MINLNSKTNVYVEIERLSKEKKISISELCRRANVPRHSISRWKKRNPLSIEQMQKLINQLEITPQTTNEND